jgi:hypothetical protein
MRLHSKVATITATLALAAPAFAVAAIPANDGTAHKPADPGSQAAAHQPSTPGPSATLPAKAKAYGKYCQNQSKKHVKGQSGTPFSKCVTAMAKLASGATTSPRSACKTESKKHVEGQSGTPFSKCVSAGAKLLHDQAAS